MKRSVFILIIAAVSALTAGAALGVWRFSPAPAVPNAISGFYALNLKNAAGQALDFNRFKGKRVVINFWATWCAPCIEEMPDLDQIAKLVKTKNIEFVGIALDSEAKVSQFALKYPISYPLVVADFAGLEIAHSFGNPSGVLPFTVLMDESGKIVHSKIGQIKQNELKKWLEL
jgi:thiol-disulfide isomerase/thioredoxin